MKRLRLDPQAYEQGGCFSLTIATAGRTPVFQDSATVDLCIEGLRAAAARYRAEVYAYCFMPDHLHVVASIPEGVNLVEFVRHFKQLTAYHFRRLPRHAGQTLWQRRFYDHGLRASEDVSAVAMYVWGNPVRAGLTSNPHSYPYSGSFVWDLNDVSGSEDPDLQVQPQAQPHREPIYANAARAGPM